MDVVFDRQAAIKLSGMSEKAYNRSFTSMQNGIGVKNKLDIRELAIQFGCIRLIPFIQRPSQASLPPSRRASADFSRPVFTAAMSSLKVDKMKLIELCGTAESEFANVSTSMNDLCFDVFGTSKEKKDPKTVKGNRDGGYYSSEDDNSSAYKKRKRMDEHAYQEWKSTVLASSNQWPKAPKKTNKPGWTSRKKVPETKVQAT
ncbi:Origin of replication complex subunit 6 [Datura stramonium]|uniref:Origin of replication complex subunit 6 n=1 Tax=Datura stramonium TaxID=4076 RepID=A0ABS8TKS0_DATST|nr:Origin of replication complex subunit 6 [Datura stramonium]